MPLGHDRSAMPEGTNASSQCRHVTSRRRRRQRWRCSAPRSALLQVPGLHRSRADLPSCSTASRPPRSDEEKRSRQSRGCSRGAFEATTTAIASKMARQALREENESARGARLWAASSKLKAKRRATYIVSDLRVGAAVQQQANDVRVACHSSRHQSCRASLRACQTVTHALNQFKVPHAAATTTRR